MGCSVEVRTGTLPSPHAPKAGVDDPGDPQMQLGCCPAQAILLQIKFTLSRRIRSLVIRPTAEGFMDVSHKSEEGMAGAFPDLTSDGGMFPDVTTKTINSLTEVETRTSQTSLEHLMNLSEKRFSKQECVASDSHMRSTDGSSCSRSSTGGISANNVHKCRTNGRKNSRKHSTSSANFDSQSETRRTSDSQRHARRHRARTTLSDSRRYSTGGTSSQACSTSGSRRHSTCAQLSHTRRYSMGRRKIGLSDSDYKNEGPALCTSKKEYQLINPVATMRSLLSPSTSVSTFFSLMCTEETLVSTSESKFPQDASKAKRCSSEVLLRPGLKRMVSSEELNWSGVPTGPPADDYCNSNISWSTPLERVDDHRRLYEDSKKKEEDDASMSECSTDAAIPIDHFIIHVGRERKRFVISSQVVTHELFKQLLVSENYKLEEESDGKFNIVLLCDTDYFQRLLFLVDQRKTLHEKRISLSSSSKPYNVLARESSRLSLASPLC